MKKSKGRRFFKRRRTNKMKGVMKGVMKGGDGDSGEKMGQEPPSTLDNVKKVADIGLQIGNNVAAAGLNYVEDGVANLAKSAGIDPTKNIQSEVAELGSKLSEVKGALESPEGQQVINELKDIAVDLGENVIAPGIQKVAESVADKSGPIMNKSAKAVLDGISATPLGPIVEIPRFLADIGGIIEDGTAMTAEVMSIGRDAVDKGKESTSRIQSAWDKLQNVVSSGNQIVANGLNAVDKTVDNYGKKMVDSASAVARPAQMGGAIRNYHNMAKLIGGRTKKAQLEFLRPKTKFIKSRKRKYH